LSKENDGNKLDEWVADTSAIGDLIIIVADQPLKISDADGDTTAT